MKYTITKSHVSFHTENFKTQGVMVGSPSITLPFLGLELGMKEKRMLRKHGVCQIDT